MSEYALQTHVIRYLSGKIRRGRNVIQATVPFPDLIFFHCYQGRTEEDGFFLKELGVKPGVADILLVGHNLFAGIELKVGKNKQSDYQRNFQYKLETYGHKYAVCRTVAEVRDLLISWGLECKNMHCIEPPRSEEEKRKAVWEMYKP